MEFKEIKKAARLEKYRGIDNALLSMRETILTVDEIRESIRSIWPYQSETYDKNGSVVIRVWDQLGLKEAEVAPAYMFIFKAI